MKTRAYLFILLWATTSPAVASKKIMEMNLLYALKIFLGIENEPVEQKEDVLLIGAGFARTGTTSFLEAMDRLGLKSYHMGMAAKTPGHFDLWLKYSQLLQEFPFDSPEATQMANEIMDSFAEHGFNATASMPACYLYKQFMQRYPNALVIMTVRGDGDGNAWAKSVQSSVGLLLKYYSRVPLRWTPMKKAQTFIKNFWGMQGAHFNDQMEVDSDQLARMYNDWVQQVRETVPADRLLVFAPQDGWGPLCEFVSPLKPEIASKCQEILAAGEPFPRSNDKAFVQRVVMVLNVICPCFELGPYIVLVGLVVLFVRRSNRSSSKSKKD